MTSASVEVRAIDVSGNEHAFWPLGGDLDADPSAKLAAIQLRFTVAPFGEITRCGTCRRHSFAPSAPGTPAP